MNTFEPNTEGVFPGLSAEEYRAAPGISQSMLKAFAAEPTPKHYQESLTRPKKVTEAMEFGTILHTAILTPDQLVGSYFLRPYTYPSKDGYKPWDGRATYCKEWRKKCYGKPIIDLEQEGRIPCIVDTVMELPVAGDIIRTGQKEVSFFKKDEESGLLLKCRVDAIATDTDGYTHLVDLKKVRRGYATEERFGVQCVDLGYDIQAASYIYITGAYRFMFVAMEEDPPFEAATWVLDQGDIEEGMRKYRTMLNSYSDYFKDYTCAGYERAVKRLKLPAWAKLKERRESEVIYEA